MTKTQYIINLALFLPLIIANFFMYGVDGVIQFTKEIKKYSKKYLTKWFKYAIIKSSKGKIKNGKRKERLYN